MKKTQPLPKLKKGFAVMKPAVVKRIASMGGQAVSKDRDYMASIGSIGGKAMHATHKLVRVETKTKKGNQQ